MFFKVLSRVERIGVYVSAALILLMMVLTTVDTFLRQAFNSPIPGVYELHSMIMIVIVYLGLSYVQSQRGHIRMDIFSTHLSTTGQNILQLLGDAIFLTIIVLITWRMGIQTWNALITGDYFYGIVKFPLWPPKAILTLGTTVLSIRLISDIIRNPLWVAKTGVSQNKRILGIFIAIAILAIIVVGLAITKNMDLAPASVGWIALILFLVLLFIGVPVAPSMALIGVIGFWLLSGVDTALGTAGTVPFASASEYIMTVLPLFIVMGAFAGLAGFAERGFNLAKRWLENIKGGIVHATVVGSTIFAAATGSGAASCAVLSKLTLPEMLKSGVQKGMAIGVVASASTLAVMIPPSTSFVIYAMLTGNSLGKLLISGIIPGLIGAAAIMATVFVRCQLNPKLVGTPVTTDTSWKERFAAIPGAWGIMLVVVIIIGGILSGYFTPTEAGAVGAFVTLAAVLLLRKGNWREISNVLADSAGIASMILIILVGGMLFGNMISITRLPNMLSEWVIGLDLPTMAILVFIMVIYFILGCFLDALSTMIVTLPIIYPIIIKLGFDPIWFGVLQVQNIEIAAVTPPYGMNLFILKGLLKDTSMAEIMLGSIWFVIPMVVTMAIYIIFPQVALWLPNLMAG